MTSIIKKSNAKMCIVADVTVAYQNMSKIGVKTVSHVGVKMCRCNTPTCATGKTDIYDTFITEDRKNEKKNATCVRFTKKFVIIFSIYIVKQ